MRTACRWVWGAGSATAAVAGSFSLFRAPVAPLTWAWIVASCTGSDSFTESALPLSEGTGPVGIDDAPFV